MWLVFEGWETKKASLTGPEFLKELVRDYNKVEVWSQMLDYQQKFGHNQLRRDYFRLLSRYALQFYETAIIISRSLQAAPRIRRSSGVRTQTRKSLCYLGVWQVEPG